MSIANSQKDVPVDEAQEQAAGGDVGRQTAPSSPDARVVASGAMATKTTSATGRARPASAKKVAVPRKRAEQQRAQSTRTAILEAALAEFAEKGFEAASIRSIAERTGFQHPLITYHYPSKDLLWQAVAEDT